MKFQNAWITVLVIAGTQSLAWAKMPKIEPAIGIGNQSLNMTLESPQDKVEYQTTNQSFWFLNLTVFDFSAQLKLPVSSNEKELKEHGNTKVVDYQFSFEFTPKWQIEVYHQDYKSYFLSSASTNIIQPDLGFSHTGGQLIYVFNPDYSASMIRTTSWKQTSSAGSWLVSWGGDTFDLSGDLNPKAKNSVSSAKADVLSLRLGYGYNWISNNWFGGIAMGMGLNYNHCQYNRGADSFKEDRSDLISNAGVGGGYRWKDNKVGVFSRIHNWKLVFGREELVSNTSSTGVYYSSVF